MKADSSNYRPYHRVLLLSSLLFCFSCEIAWSADNEKVIPLSEDVTLQKIDEGIWIHTSSYEVAGFGLVPANGLVIVSDGTGMIIDLPWTDAQTKLVFDWFRTEHEVEIDTVVPTHSHQDCSGGLSEAHRQGAGAWALVQTVEKLKAEEKAFPENAFTNSKKFQRGSLEVILSFEGGAHTTDNIIAWIPSRKILFGGCAVKSLEAANIGYVKEADAKSWPLMLNGLLEKYPDAKRVIPGHGNSGGLDLIRHSLKMVNEGKKLGLFGRKRN